MIDLPAAAAAAESLAITAAAGIGFGIGGHARRLVAVGAKGGGSSRATAWSGASSGCGPRGEPGAWR